MYAWALIKFFRVYCTCAVILSVSLYGYRVAMTRPTTARLLATKTCYVKPGQYSYLWTGQYHFLFIFTMGPRYSIFYRLRFLCFSAILNINYIITSIITFFSLWNICSAAVYLSMYVMYLYVFCICIHVLCSLVNSCLYVLFIFRVSHSYRFLLIFGRPWNCLMYYYILLFFGCNTVMSLV